VTIGGVPCTVTGSSSSSSITCIVGNGPSGSQRILVNVDGKGLSSGNVLFTYISGINDISPDSGSLGGRYIFLHVMIDNSKTLKIKK
jgi:hypothetical protein